MKSECKSDEIQTSVKSKSRGEKNNIEKWNKFNKDNEIEKVLAKVNYTV